MGIPYRAETSSVTDIFEGRVQDADEHVVPDTRRVIDGDHVPTVFMALGRRNLDDRSDHHRLDLSPVVTGLDLGHVVQHTEQRAADRFPERAVVEFG